MDLMDKAHDQLTRKLLQAARDGSDLLAILRSEHAHLQSCPVCRRKLLRFAEEASGLDAAAWLEMIQSAEQDGLPEPPRIPRPDFSVLENRASPAGLVRLPGEIRMGPPGSGPGLEAIHEVILPGRKDLRCRLRARARAEGRACLELSLESIPADVQRASLILTGEGRKDQAAIAAQETARFDDLLPGSYRVELTILPKGQGWLFTLRLESTASLRLEKGQP